jgi:hypothetical protein
MQKQANTENTEDKKYLGLKTTETNRMEIKTESTQRTTKNQNAKIKYQK